MVNKVTLIGHLGKDPEIRTLENGTKVGTFSLATNESYKDKNDNWQTLTEWHNIVVWRGLAERAERELKKGQLAYIEGKITHRKYQDKDGTDRSTTEIVANTVNSLERKENKQNLSAGLPTLEDDPFNRISGSVSTSTPPSSAEEDLPF
ncbi:MAG: single-stranded DNA-binding protein [Saprospiraceae bacterium]|nr:single-stranded DNA-binding protein [Saprospiraceae bacterium]MBK8668253.1 single-stranded DNA-binding protein [Saprospiraceae bacterium]MBL0099269.1 single-stranded DNA-binding protein [Saprospiraceae bacterium]